MGRKASTTARVPQIKPTAIAGFHRALQKWYQTHGRHSLPWRNTDDPYHIWLSEVMLQQTQVATVLARFYHPFLKKFPTVKDLADAPREKVMKAWEGLGYYRRAGHLHEAAKLVSDLSPRVYPGVQPNNKLRALDAARSRHRTGMTLPKTIDALLTLPGIGRNTAHAIAAFAYHQPVAILEANVKRVVARVFALERPSDAELWAGAETLLNRDAPFDYNQAMMDLGSIICTPKNPQCRACPAASICKGRTSPGKYPAPKVKTKIPTREVLIHVREDARGRFILEKRNEKLLGGLHGFPQAPHPTHHAPRTTHQFLGTVTHTYSHFKLIGHVVYEKIDEKPNSPDWHTREEIAALPLSKLDHKVLALVKNCHSAQKKPAKSKASRHGR